MNLIYIVSLNKFNINVFHLEDDATNFIKSNKSHKPFGYSTDIDNFKYNIQSIYFKNKWKSLKELPETCTFKEVVEERVFTLKITKLPQQ